MSGSILWYVHDHGLGHLQRALAVIPHLSTSVVIATGPGVSDAAATAFDGTVVALPSDVDAHVGPTVGPWHHAPSGDAVRARSRAIAETVDRYDCTTAVVDVSAEVTVLARLLGLRVVCVRQSGRRDDDAHRIAFATADVVWVPQHRDLEPTGDERVDERWQFTGAFSRFDEPDAICDRPRPAASPTAIAARRTVVMMVGRGGHSFDVDTWRDASAPLGWRVVVLGVDQTDHDDDTDDGTGVETGVEFVGRVDDVGPLLRAADVVVTSAGWASVADAVTCGCRLVVIAEDRPFDEQLVRAQRLHELGLAVRLDRWPLPGELPGVLDRVASLPGDGWSPFSDRLGARRAARIIERCHAS